MVLFAETQSLPIPWRVLVPLVLAGVALYAERKLVDKVVKGLKLHS